MEQKSVSLLIQPCRRPFALLPEKLQSPPIVSDYSIKGAVRLGANPYCLQSYLRRGGKTRAFRPARKRGPEFLKREIPAPGRLILFRILLSLSGKPSLYPILAASQIIFTQASMPSAPLFNIKS